MTVCSLFGDCDTPESMWENIETALTILITDYNVDFFYLGNTGNFDEMAETILFNLCQKHPHVGYNVILCVEAETKFTTAEIYKRNLSPIFAMKSSSIKNVQKRINLWMIKEADYVLIHTKHPDSEVSDLRKNAQSNNKMIIPLCCE